MRQRARHIQRAWRLPLTLGLVAGLAGCDALEGDPGGGFGFAPRQSAPRGNATPLTRTELLGGQLVVSGPKDYCIDAGSLRRSSGFALLASCWNLTEGKAGSPVEPAILTVSAVRVPQGATLPDAATLAESIGSGAPSATRETDTLTLIRLDRGGQDGIAGGDPRHWRGAMMQGDRVVMLAAYAPEGGATTGALGADLLTALADNIRRDSPRRDVPPVGTAPTADPPAGTKTATTGQGADFGAAIRRLFN